MSEEMKPEWSVQYRTNSGGHFDRVHTKSTRTGLAYTEKTARKAAEEFNKGKKPENQCRVAQRMVTKWVAS